MSKQIKNSFPNASITGNGTNPRTGSFEVKIDGALVFSKFAKNSFPDDTEIQSWFEK